MKRKLKKYHWGWIIAAVIIVAILVVPVEEFQQSVEGTEQKLSILQSFLKTLTTTTKAATSFMVALAALLAYWVLKKK